MIELLLIQAITTAALAIFVIKLRRELYPMVATAGPWHAGFWVRSIDVLVLAAPQFEAAKTVLRVRWLLEEELFLIYRFRVYYVAMHPHSHHNYKNWKKGDDRYRCLAEEPRGLSKLYNKAIEVICLDMESETGRRLWETLEVLRKWKRKT
jgi:hypothetical protein